MEIGAVAAELFFDPDKKRVAVKLGQTFSTLVNPESEVSAAALDITGIKQAELNAAPVWRAVKGELRGFLGQAILLGHNLGFDLAFLAAQGLKLKNSFWDSLEVAQTLLPLSPGHSLEYLGDRFAILEGGSHRALADSQTAARVLAAIVNEVLTLPEELQTEIKKLLRGTNLAWASLILDLPEIEIKHKVHAAPPSAYAKASAGRSQRGASKGFDFPATTILAAPLAMNLQGDFLAGLARHKKPAVIAVSHSLFLDRVPEEQVLPSPSFALCDVKFAELRKQGGLDDTSVKMLIKILIFQDVKGGFDLLSIKWTEGERELLDLFACEPAVCRAHECGFAHFIKTAAKTVSFCNLATLFSLVNEWEINFHAAAALLFDLSAIEEQFTESRTDEWNLRRARRFARGEEKLLDELDLFFGILHLVYRKREEAFAENIIIDEHRREEWPFAKLFHPAEKLLRKLAAAPLAGSRLPKFIREFFLEPQRGKIYWLRFNAAWVELSAAPREIASLFKKFQKSFRSVTILDTEAPAIAMAYFEKRLGLEHYSHEKLKIAKPRAEFPVALVVQPDLRALPGSTIAVFGNERELQNFFESAKIQPGAKEVIAYKFSGSLSAVRLRLASAEAARREFILGLTTYAYQRYFVVLPPAQNLFLQRLPFEAPGQRPELGATSFPETVLPRAMHLLHRMICRFTATALPGGKIFIADRRILTDYDRAFLRYFEEFPDFQISTG